MMRTKILAFVFFLLAFVVHAQDSLMYDDPNKEIPSKEFRPSLGVGIGTFGFFGNVSSGKARSAYASPIVYSFYAARRITQSLDFGLRFSLGDMIGNETGPKRYLNFKTTIYSGTAFISYNFENFLPKNKILKPYLSLGFSVFEFNNKGDLYDANGNKYYYWSDGLIRNMDESSPQAAQSVRLQRDYAYETDLRTANIDGLGRYQQVGFAIPIGLEFEFSVTERFSFRVGSIFYYSFTNLIDNVSEAGTGIRSGQKGGDHFFQNTISAHYDLFGKRRKLPVESFVFPDYFAMDVNDQDKDGVINEFDICPFTIKDVQVDKNGCPIDLDLDGVPDIVDREKSTPLLANVNKDGVALTDDDYLMWYLKYIDSLDIPQDVLERLASRKVKSATYRVFLQELELGKDISDSLFAVYNAEADLKVFNVRGNNSVFTVGEYGSISDAEERKFKLQQKGFSDAEVVVFEDDQIIEASKWKEMAENQMRERFKADYERADSLNNFYAIHLGSSSAGASNVEKAKFLADRNVIALPGERNSTDYVVGPYIDTVSAAQNMQNYLDRGFLEAKITKVLNGRVVDKNKVIENDDLANFRAIDSLDDFNKLKMLDGKLVLKIGSINSKSTKAESDRLYGDKDAIIITNKDKTIDFVYPLGYENEQDVEIKKHEYLKKGFDNPEIASVLFEEDQIKLIYKEVLDSKYTISLGSFKASVNSKEEEKILSIPDVRSVQTYDPTVNHYTVGVFGQKGDAKDRVIDLYKQGYSPQIVKYEKGKFNIVDVRDVFSEQELEQIKAYKMNPTLKTNEVVFRVQVGAYKNKISENQFRSSAVISFFTENGVHKYLSDGTSTYKNAYIKKLKMRELGFKDAFVVAHKDGKRIDVKDLVNREEFKKIQEELGDYSLSTPAKIEVNISGVFTDGQSKSDLVYKVQLGAFKDMQAQDKFSEFNDVQMEIYGEYKRFLTGNFSTYEEAAVLKESAKAKGFSNAFVVAYQKGQRMTEPDHNVNVIKTNEGVRNFGKDSELKHLVIMVQIGMFKGALPPDVAALFETLPKITKEITPQGIIRYMVGNFRDPAEATAYKHELISKGFQGVFLVAFYKSEKIDIKEAIEIYRRSK